MRTDYYELLHISKKASKQDIRIAYINMSKKCHPDVEGGSEEAFKQMKEAYDILSNDYKKTQYDLGLEIRDINYDGYVNRYMFYGIYFPTLPLEEDDKTIEDLFVDMDAQISIMIGEAQAWEEDRWAF